MANHEEEPKARIERLIGEGKITREAVDAAERLWVGRLRNGVVIPNGELIIITLRDLHHVLVDDRIWRKPERIEQALLGIFEIRPGRLGRRVALSRWMEDDKSLFGMILIEVDNTLRSLHLVDSRRLSREMRKGEALWKR
ncbi:MAG TPA: hypothetical protein VJ183_16025 [Chloroflexia bacterium]|nr:hypothetical protein [Chloroflexia bacterium]